MKHLIKLAAMTTICVAAAGCQVNKTQEGKLPKVAVKTTDGQLPAYNVQGPDVQIGSKNETIKVPTVKVTTPDKKN
jgi:hypothetical protein